MKSGRLSTVGLLAIERVVPAAEDFVAVRHHSLGPSLSGANRSMIEIIKTKLLKTMPFLHILNVRLYLLPQFRSTNLLDLSKKHRLFYRLRICFLTVENFHGWRRPSGVVQHTLKNALRSR